MEKQELEDDKSTGQLKVNEEVEKLIKEVKTWESETQTILDLLRQEDVVDGSSVDALQVRL